MNFNLYDIINPKHVRKAQEFQEFLQTIEQHYNDVQVSHENATERRILAVSEQRCFCSPSAPYSVQVQRDIQEYAQEEQIVSSTRTEIAVKIHSPDKERLIHVYCQIEEFAQSRGVVLVNDMPIAEQSALIATYDHNDIRTMTTSQHYTLMERVYVFQ